MVLGEEDSTQARGKEAQVIPKQMALRIRQAERISIDKNLSAHRRNPAEYLGFGATVLVSWSKTRKRNIGLTSGRTLVLGQGARQKI